jgi:hypothetical protein
MRGRRRYLGPTLTLALALALLGMLKPGGRAQEAKPTIWPQIEVWGVSGHSFGTIRVMQPTVNGLLRYSLLAEFVPADNKLLSEIAVTLWPGAGPKCLHFNWIQITRKPGNPPLPVDTAGRFVNPPYLDPPAQGYYADPKPADSLPWFLDETPYVAGKSADMNIHNPNISLPNGLRWYARPYSTSVPDTMQYDTLLVLINDCTGQYQPLGGFHWTALFPQSGAPSFTVMPFGPSERFAEGSLVSEFAGGGSARKRSRIWTIRPLVKP